MTELQEAINLFKESENHVKKLMNAQQAFVVQLNENGMVQQELSLLEDEAEVFKAIGPVLVKVSLLLTTHPSKATIQVDLNDARASVKQRIDRLTSEV